MLLDRLQEQCEIIMEKYRYYRIPDELIVNVEDVIIIELMEYLSFLITSSKDSKIKYFELNYTRITTIPPASLTYFQDIFFKKPAKNHQVFVILQY